MFAGFEQVRADGVGIHAVTGGAGPPVLLHGFPQTHVRWHPIAERRATVVAPDLRGYGDSADLHRPSDELERFPWAG